MIPCPCPPPPLGLRTALGILVSGVGGIGGGLTNGVAVRFTQQALANYVQWR